MTEVVVSRAWAMPSRHTLTIPPILEFVNKHMLGQNGWWVDPFAGYHSIAGETNDLDPDAPVLHHLDARVFLERVGNIHGLFFNPPYSPRQISECYKSIG